jgi:hypothetical protein
VNTEILREMEEILEDYTLEGILAENGLSEAEALYHLYRSGVLELPETKPITAGRGGPVRFDEVF